jgi:hypothetical protein
MIQEQDPARFSLLPIDRMPRAEVRTQGKSTLHAA